MASSGFKQLRLKIMLTLSIFAVLTSIAYVVGLLS